ncbi:MAG: PhzF family phenazine biosynthesis protein [Deltaproteobacteria bacterium]|jgi:PhzF family phenazine biosynthesis protein|nr:PhzF family phenazine biosynthesis protein [Deltaproteobacteria bacterium]
MIRKIFLVDAFVDGPFTGSPTGVIFLRNPLERSYMISLASELETQETLFVLLNNQSFGLRFFSQTQEIPLSVHACLAGAHLIYELGLFPVAKDLLFLTQEGQIVANTDQTGAVTLTAASQLLTKLDQVRLDQFRTLLNYQPGQVAWAALSPQKVIILALEKPELIKATEVNHYELTKTQAAGLAVTAQSLKPDSDYFLRCFLPLLGVNEEHVSGNIHRSLAPQWGRLLQKKRLVCRQMSQRGGLVSLELLSPAQISFTGRATTVFKGDLKLTDIPELA